MNKKQVQDLLANVGFFDFIKDFGKLGYNSINYGPKLGSIDFENILDADFKYKYNEKASKENFRKWNEVLNSNSSSQEECLVVCVSIFDWGGVTDSNLTASLDLYNRNALAEYVDFIRPLVYSEEFVSEELAEKILWSSGWTKVYSAINQKFVIYDSRVAAYVIFLLDQFVKSNYFQSVHKEEFFNLSSHFFTMPSARTRRLETMVPHRKSKPAQNVRCFNTNLLASWFIQLLCEHVFISKSVRQIERAFFMLGFDLDQLEVKQF